MTHFYLTKEQRAQLLKAINPRRVGTDGKGFSHVEAYEIRAHLNRCFGFARWSADVVEQEQIFETSAVRRKKDKKGVEYGDPYEAWTVCYRTVLRLTVCAPDGTVLATYTEGATGEATNQPGRGDAHDLALKTSESQALKRTAFNLGDQFGLSLFMKGSTAALVKRTLLDSGEAAAPTESVDSHVTEIPPEDAPPEAEPEIRETNRPEPAADVESDVRVAQANAIRAEALEAKTAREITQLMVAAGRQSLNNIMVDSAVGPHRIALKQFLDNQIKSVAAASRVAS